MKKLLVIFIILLLCGCSANASIEIDENYNVDENVSIYMSNQIIEQNGISLDELIDNQIKYYQNTEFIDFSKYNIKTTQDGNKVGAIFSKTTNDFCNTFNTTSFKHFFSNLNCEETNDYYVVNGSSNYICHDEESSECAALKEANLNITIFPKVIESNADNVNNNIYTWNFDGDNDKLYLIVKKDTKKSKKGNIITKNNNKFTIVGVILIILIILLLIVLLFDKYKKNKMEY